MATFFTLGHSTRTQEEFLALLRPFRVATLVDVRRFPASRRYPQFNQGALAAALAEAGIEYVHEEALGGRRPARKDTTNTGWRVDGFRGYADYMATRPFAEALTRLEQYARLGPAALLCAEAVPWRCHRQLIADALLVRGHTVKHIMSPTRADTHKLPEFAVVHEDGTITYPPPQGELEL